MKFNRKGYMLIEIILASVIAFGIGYFILQMIINLKNKNDDLLVETLTTTDQTIIMNKLMDYAKSEENNFSCKNESGEDRITISGKTIKFDDEVVDIVNDYASIGVIGCDYTDGLIKISIPLEVKQLSNKDFDVVFNYNLQNGTISIPSEQHECYKEFDACPDEWRKQSNGCFYYISANTIDYTGGGGCEANCSQHGGTCSGTICYYCNSEYRYNDHSCYKNTDYSECSGNGWEKRDDGCYKINCNN